MKKKPKPDDKAILDWIEAELIRSIGSGDFWHAMHDVHRGQSLREAAIEYMSNDAQRKAQFIASHPLAKALSDKEIAFAMNVAENHRAIKLYRSKSEIILSREAMYTPECREFFIVRKAIHKSGL